MNIYSTTVHHFSVHSFPPLVFVYIIGEVAPAHAQNAPLDSGSLLHFTWSGSAPGLRPGQLGCDQDISVYPCRELWGGSCRRSASYQSCDSFIQVRTLAESCIYHNHRILIPEICWRLSRSFWLSRIIFNSDQEKWVALDTDNLIEALQGHHFPRKCESSCLDRIKTNSLRFKIRVFQSKDLFKSSKLC